MADDFEKFKKMYKEGEVKILANPPPMPGATGAVRGAVVKRGQKLIADKLGKSAGTRAPAGSSAASQGGRASGGTRPPSGSGSAPQAGRASGGTSAPGGARSAAQAGRNSGGTSAPGGSAGRPQASRNSGGARPTGRSGDKNFIGPRERPRSGDKDFIGPTPRAPKPGEKGFIGPMRGAAGARNFGGKMAAGAAAGAGLLGFAAYNSADKPKASDNKANNSKLTGGSRDDRASSGGGTFKPINRDNLSENGKKTFDAQQGRKKKPVVKKAVDKSSAAAKPEKKMSNFERMKKRGYEKEGFGGRSMTSRGAESRVKKERSFKFKDLFAKKKK